MFIASFFYFSKDYTVYLIVYMCVQYVFCAYKAAIYIMRTVLRNCSCLLKPFILTDLAQWCCAVNV